MYQDKSNNWFVEFYSFIAKKNDPKWLGLEILRLNDGKFCSSESKLYIGQNDYKFKLSEIKSKGFNILNKCITENDSFLKFLRNNSRIYSCFDILTSNPELVYDFDDDKLVQLYQKLIAKKVNWAEIKIIKTSQNLFVAGNKRIFNPFVTTIKLDLDSVGINSLNQLFHKEKQITKYFDEEKSFGILKVSDVLLQNPELVYDFSDNELINLYRYLFSFYDRFNENLKIIKLNTNEFISANETDEVYTPNSSIKVSSDIKILSELFFEEQNKDILQKLNGFFEIKEFNQLDNILKIVIPEIADNIDYIKNIGIVEKALNSNKFRKGDKIEIKEKLKEIDFLPLKEIDDNDGDETVFGEFNTEFYDSINRNKYHHFCDKYIIYKLDTNLIDSNSIILKECCNHYYPDFTLFQDINYHICEVLEICLENDICDRQISQSILDHLVDYIKQSPNNLDKYRSILNQHTWLVSKNKDLVKPADIKIEDCDLEIPEIVVHSGILNFKVEKEYSKQTKSEVGEDNMELLNHMEKEGATPEYVKQLIEKDKKSKEEEEKQAKKLEEQRVKQTMEENQKQSQENNSNSQSDYSSYDTPKTNNYEFNTFQKTNSQDRNERIKLEVDQVCEESPDETIKVAHHTRSKPNRKNQSKASDNYYQEKNNAESNMTDQEQYQKFEESQDQKIQNKLVGYRAEEIAYIHLCDQYGSENVTWNNQNGESGVSWDIEIEDGEDTIFYEIKGKLTSEARKCFVTFGEWQRAKIELDNFILLVVILEKNTITEIRNPYQKWLDDEIDVNPLVLTY